MSILRKPFRYANWNTTFILIGINLAVFLLTEWNDNFVAYLSLNPVLVTKYHWYWQIFTYQFVHGGMGHLLSNMIGLFFFGFTLERRIGSKEFLLVYLLSGTLCGLFSLIIYLATGTMKVMLMGASGAVFAILLMYAVFFPRSTIYLWWIIPVPAPLLIIGYAAIETFYMVSGRNQGVAHSTHLIGFAIAWIYCLVRFGVNPLKVWFGRR
ncbi:rhomboid family intramembrane serine protease [Brucepastera parasyntrophica]|uniref:rhomboid family intramembrane serine protease n=1 Tax=Brucepastera parasyntrophica TaxID=2880008 RepID=UPI00210B9BC8|nr:rhomboid family intramembrane serine protease [Brucepastera parasyntrophica]ULQ61173.1 rhomboid family intramembrane serine protease [Brucepastera parasyntrophica]